MYVFMYFIFWLSCQNATEMIMFTFLHLKADNRACLLDPKTKLSFHKYFNLGRQVDKTLH